MGQMMTDDWRPDLANEWYNTDTWEWRNDENPAAECPTEPNPDHSLDVTGALLTLLQGLGLGLVCWPPTASACCKLRNHCC